MTARTPSQGRPLPDSVPSPRRGRAARTAIGRARGRHRMFLIATCGALVLAAIGDEATGHDGPGPFIDLAFAAMAALVWWRSTPLPSSPRPRPSTPIAHPVEPRAKESIMLRPPRLSRSTLITFAGLMMLFTARWWWHAFFGVFTAFWIVGVGTLANKLTPNLTSHNTGTVVGNAIMAAGLILAFFAGVHSMITARRTRRAARNNPDLARQR